MEALTIKDIEKPANKRVKYLKTLSSLAKIDSTLNNGKPKKSIPNYILREQMGKHRITKHEYSILRRRWKEDGFVKIFHKNSIWVTEKLYRFLDGAVLNENPKEVDA